MVAVHRARLPVHAADRRGLGGPADRLRLERPLHRAGRRDRPGAVPCLPVAARYAAAGARLVTAGLGRAARVRRSGRWCSGSRATPRARSRRAALVAGGSRARRAGCARAASSARAAARRSVVACGVVAVVLARDRRRRSSSATTWSGATRTRARGWSSPRPCAGRATSAARRSPSPGSVASSTSTRSTGPTSPTASQWLGYAGRARCLAADPELRAVAPGDQRGRLHPRRDHLRPLPPGSSQRHDGGALDPRGPGGAQPSCARAGAPSSRSTARSTRRAAPGCPS